MSGRIERTFAVLREKNRAALIPFIMGGDPELATTAALLDALPKAGADIIEIGVPFSDPMADGKTIEAAGQRALKSGTTLAKILELVRTFRNGNADTPIILMGYYNPIYRFGGKDFCEQAAEAGVDGLIIVDLPPEEEPELRGFIDQNALSLIRLVAPTSGDERLPLLAKSASGFVYYISITGITGAASANLETLRAQIAHMKTFTPLPVAVGFGIKTAQQAAQVGQFADAVVVGSALVDRIAAHSEKNACVKAAVDFVSEIALGLKR